MLDKNKLLSEINFGIEKIRNSRPLTNQELSELQKSLGIMFTYNSNAIEGNTISLGETKLILEDGITIGGKTLRELKETINHKYLLEILYDFLKNNEDLTEDLIKKIHLNVMKDIDENAGEYRKIQVYITGDDKLPTKASNIGKEMGDLMTWYNENKNKLNPVLLAIEFHYKFVKIHPFIDGNGRTIRLLINMILMKRGFPMIIIPLIKRQEYIGSLNSNSNLENFTMVMLDIINENVKDYLRMIGVD